MFGPYRLDVLLGVGGMGEVWRAFDTRRERDVALKRLTDARADNAMFRGRFEREARLIARLSSAHVIPIHDFGEIDGQPFLDMRLVSNGDLADLLGREESGLGPERAVEVIAQLADALDAAHARGMIHRDVKPSNVLVDTVRSREFCYLADFGIARILHDTTGAGQPLTAEGTRLGTPNYMAPELFTGESRGSVGSDVYALGCLLFELLTGRRPFDGNDSAVLMHQHLHQPPPSPSDVDGSSEIFDDIVRGALAKNVDDRFPTASSLAQAALGAARGEPIEPRAPRSVRRTTTADSPPTPPSTPPTLRASARPAPVTETGPALATEPRRRRRRAIAAIAAITTTVVLASAGLVVWSELGSSPDPPPPGPSAFAARPMAAPVSDPRGLSASADGKVLFVTGGLQDGTVSVIDPVADVLRSTIKVGSVPNSVAPSSDGKRAWVALQGTDPAQAGSVAVVDLGTEAVTARIPIGIGPSSVVLSPDGARAWVTNSGSPSVKSNTVSVIDTARNVVVGTVSVERGPRSVAFAPDGRTAYVTNSGYPDVRSSISVVDTRTLTVRTTVQVGDVPIGVALTRDGRTAYVGTNGTTLEPVGSVAVVDTEKPAVVTRLQSGAEGPFAVALTPDGRHVLVTNTGDVDDPGTSVSVIDTATNRVVSTVQVGQIPYDVVAGPDSHRAYVTTNTGLWVIDIP